MKTLATCNFCGHEEYRERHWGWRKGPDGKWCCFMDECSKKADQINDAALEECSHSWIVIRGLIWRSTYTDTTIFHELCLDCGQREPRQIPSAEYASCYTTFQGVTWRWK